MSEFELTDALSTQISLAITFFMAYLSTTSAYLAVTYVAGNELPRSLARTILAIYVLAAYFLVISFQRVLTFAIAIQDKMATSVDWHPVAHEPAWLLPTSMWIIVSVMVMLSVASIWYAIHSARSK
jgi:hypothetical protein